MHGLHCCGKRKWYNIHTDCLILAPQGGGKAFTRKWVKLCRNFTKGCSCVDTAKGSSRTCEVSIGGIQSTERERVLRLFTHLTKGCQCCRTARRMSSAQGVSCGGYTARGRPDVQRDEDFSNDLHRSANMYCKNVHLIGTREKELWICLFESNQGPLAHTECAWQG